MGLGSKQGLGWMSTDENPAPAAAPAKRNQSQLQQQQHERLECPRCGSTNTKFCYYNNYNKSQPRHLCKACKRHWTKGGTLRSVPVGGGRKNKRVKLSSNTSPSNIINHHHNNNIVSAVNISSMNKDVSSFIHGGHDPQKCNSDTLFSALLRPPSSLQNGSVNSFMERKAFMVNNGGLGSSSPSSSSSMLMMRPSQPHHPQDQSIKFSSLSNTHDHHHHQQQQQQLGRMIDNSMESTITTTSLPTTSSISSPQPWQQQDPLMITSATEDLPSFWSWNALDSSVSTDLDNNIPWSVYTQIEF